MVEVETGTDDVSIGGNCDPGLFRLICLFRGGVEDFCEALNGDLEVSVVINRGPTHPRVPEIAEAIVCLQEFPSLPFSGVVLHERRAFRKAMTLGLSVAELEPPDPKAVAEIRFLYNTIYYAETESHAQ